MCPGKEALFLIFFSLFSNKQDSVCAEKGLSRHMMNMQKLSEILAAFKLHPLITFLLLNT